MSAKRIYAFLFCAIAVSFVPGCALLSKGEPGAARYFSLEQAPPSSDAVPAKSDVPLDLRLGRVTGATHLEERLVYRDSTNEIGYYRDLRWTEPPEQYLKRLLSRVLYEERGLRHVVGGAGSTLEVHLTAFDEIRSPQHLARVEVVVKLHDEHVVLWEETLTQDRPIVVPVGGDPALATVEAFGEAMRGLVDRIADRAARELEKRNEPHDSLKEDNHGQNK